MAHSLTQDVVTHIVDTIWREEIPPESMIL
jgi:hypothetical protein